MSEQRSTRTEIEAVSRVERLLGLLGELTQRDPSPALRERLRALAAQRLRIRDALRRMWAKAAGCQSGSSQHSLHCSSVQRDSRVFWLPTFERTSLYLPIEPPKASVPSFRRRTSRTLRSRRNSLGGGTRFIVGSPHVRRLQALDE